MHLTLLRQTERAIAYLRTVAVLFAVLQVIVVDNYPPGYERKAWIVTIVFAIGSALLLARSRIDLPRPRQVALSVTSLVFDIAIVSAYLLVYNFERASPIRQLFYLVVVEGAVRFGVVGGIRRQPRQRARAGRRTSTCASDDFNGDFRTDYVALQIAGQVIVGLIVGTLVAAAGEAVGRVGCARGRGGGVT